MTQSKLAAAAEAIGITAGVVVLLLAAEMGVRYFADVTFFGNSRNLFAPAAFLSNTPDVRAVSFGAEVITDHYGFRVPRPRYDYPPHTRRLLIVGDSIAFGPGVSEPETFAGRLRNLGGWSIYNAAVIGHGAFDYDRVVEQEIERIKPNVVYLVLCLNDVSAISASAIKAAPVDQLKRYAPVAALNEVLRDNSKLYIYLKGLLTDPSQRYFMADWQQYQDPQAVAEALTPLQRIAERLKARGIEFTVLISPYEYQLRRMAPAESLLPQRTIAAILAERGIRFVDLAQWFRADGGENYFLRFDPMHFSPEGHRVIYSGLARVLNAAAPSPATEPSRATAPPPSR
jgi:lysophospholipase L1-like esterase